MDMQENLKKTNMVGKFDLIKRYSGNPVITVNDIPNGAARVCNSGFTIYNGHVYGLLHAPTRSYKMRHLLAKSKDGINFEIEDKNLVPDLSDEWFTEGLYDIRITKLENKYYYTFNVGHNSHGTRIYLMSTENFKTFDKIGFIAGPSQRNCVLFPEKINGKYVRLERPHGGGTNGDIYISDSPDLRYWGNTKLFYGRGRNNWESVKVGPGAPPVKTSEGWLLIYHGVCLTCGGERYYAGCMLLDLEHPQKILGVLDEYLFCPEAEYEQVGHTMNVVFPTAAIIHENPDELKIYYGAADYCIGLAYASVSQLVEACLNAPYKPHWRC